jgi:hypothetical protein
MPIINVASLARSVLDAKISRVEHAREMGKRNRGPWTPERKRKMAETFHPLNHVSNEMRRIYRSERRSRWLTNCIVTHPDRKTFDLAGVDPLAGRRFAVHITMPLDATLLDFLLLVMRCEDAPMIMRLDCAKNAAPLMHERPKPEITVVEYERRLERRRERNREASRRSYARLRAAKAGEA